MGYYSDLAHNLQRKNERLKKENEQMKKETIEIEKVSDYRWEENERLKKDNEQLKKNICRVHKNNEKLKAQIEKMKCCYLCKKVYECAFADVFNHHSCDNWELAE